MSAGLSTGSRVLVDDAEDFGQKAASSLVHGPPGQLFGYRIHVGDCGVCVRDDDCVSNTLQDPGCTGFACAQLALCAHLAGNVIADDHDARNVSAYVANGAAVVGPVDVLHRPIAAHGNENIFLVNSFCTVENGLKRGADDVPCFRPHNRTGCAKHSGVLLCCQRHVGIVVEQNHLGTPINCGREAAL